MDGGSDANGPDIVRRGTAMSMRGRPVPTTADRVARCRQHQQGSGWAMRRFPGKLHASIFVDALFSARQPFFVTATPVETGRSSSEPVDLVNDPTARASDYRQRGCVGELTGADPQDRLAHAVVLPTFRGNRTRKDHRRQATVERMPVVCQAG